MNDCYRLAESRREKLVHGAWCYCDEPSDPAIPGPLPISTPPTHATMQNAAKANANRNIHSYHGDGNRWWGSHSSTKSRIVISSWDTRTMWTYAAKIWQHSHCTIQAMHREYVRESALEKGWEEITRYPAVRNYTNSVDLRNLRKSEWEHELGKLNTACSSADLICEYGRWTAGVCGLLSSQ